MVEAAQRVDLPPPGGVAWLDLSATSGGGSPSRVRTGPLGMQIAPLAGTSAPFQFRGARLRGTRCIWTAATLSGAELRRAPNSYPGFADGAVHVIVRSESPGSVFDPAVPRSRGTLRVVEPLSELREQFAANTHLFTLNVQRSTLGLEQATIADLQDHTLELTELQDSLLRAAVSLFRGGGELGSAPTLVGVDRYLGALAGLLLRTAVRRPGTDVEQMETIRSRTDTLIFEQAVDPLLSPASVAAQLNISLRQLYRAFTGTESPAARIRRRRLEHAAELLVSRAPSVQVERVAQECGFVSAEYFSRAFRREYGMSPRAYRSANRDRVRRAVHAV
jgi:AraC-like DNA-binding protein